MEWAIKDNQRIGPIPGSKAKCPLCKEVVISKCGQINLWHWAHQSKVLCDSWSEPETRWHKDWKNEFDKECQEFIMGRHIADIRTKNRWIIELQNSTISSEEIIDREEYYKRMIWLINGETIGKGISLRIDNRLENNIVKFQWLWPAKSWWFAKKEIYVDLEWHVKKLKDKLGERYREVDYYKPYEELFYDFNYKGIKYLEKLIEKTEDKILLIRKIHKETPCYGWGILITKEEFLKKW